MKRFCSKLSGFVVAGHLLGMVAFGATNSTVSTPIAGFLKVPLPAGQMSMISFPLLNHAVSSGTFSSKSGNSLVSSTASFNPATLTQKNYANEPLYYLEIKSGPQAGLVVDIVNVISNSITIADASGLSGNEQFSIRKYLTLADVFGGSNQAGLKPGPNESIADVVYLVVNGSWKQFYYYDDGVGFDPTQWVELGGPSIDAATARIDPDQGTLVARKPGSGMVTPLVTGIVKESNAQIPVFQGMQIVTNPWPTAMSFDQMGLRTGNASTGLLEGSSEAVADVVYRLEGGVWAQYYIYNDGVGFDPVTWLKLGGGSVDQGGAVVNPGEAILIQRRSSVAFNWKPAKNF